MMKRKKIGISAIVWVLMIPLFAIPGVVLAADSEDSYLGNDGKMEMQVGRVTKPSDEKKTEADTEQTELEKLGITLFTPEAEKSAKEIKAFEKKQMDDVKASLFTGESQKDNSVETMKASVFTEQEGAVKQSEASTLGRNMPAKKSDTIWWVLSSIVLAVGAMLYMVVRKVWE